MDLEEYVIMSSGFANVFYFKHWQPNVAVRPYGNITSDSLETAIFNCRLMNRKGGVANFKLQRQFWQHRAYKPGALPGSRLRKADFNFVKFTEFGKESGLNIKPGWCGAVYKDRLVAVATGATDYYGDNEIFVLYRKKGGWEWRKEYADGCNGPDEAINWLIQFWEDENFDESV